MDNIDYSTSDEHIDLQSSTGWTFPNTSSDDTSYYHLHDAPLSSLQQNDSSILNNTTHIQSSANVTDWRRIGQWTPVSDSHANAAQSSGVGLDDFESVPEHDSARHMPQWQHMSNESQYHMFDDVDGNLQASTPMSESLLLENTESNSDFEGLWPMSAPEAVTQTSWPMPDGVARCLPPRDDSLYLLPPTSWSGVGPSGGTDTCGVWFRSISCKQNDGPHPRTERLLTTSKDSQPSRYRGCTPKGWDRIRPDLFQLYVVEGKSLAQTMHILAQEHGFRASEQVFKKRMRAWGIGKNMTAARKQQAITRLEHFENSAVKVQVSEEQMDKVVRYARGQYRAGGCQLGSLKMLKRLRMAIRHNIFDTVTRQWHLQGISQIHQQLSTTTPSFPNPNGRDSSSEPLNTSSLSYELSADRDVRFREALLVMLRAGTPRVYADDNAVFQVLDLQLEDARIHISMGAFLTGFSTMQEVLKQNLEYLRHTPLAFLLLFPYLAVDRWKCQEMPQALISLLDQASSASYASYHPLRQVMGLIQQKSPDEYDQATCWRWLIEHYDSSGLEDPAIWYHFILNWLQSCRRAVWYGEGSTQIEDILEMSIGLVSKQTLTHRQTATLEFERARLMLSVNDCVRGVQTLQAVIQSAKTSLEHRLEIKALLRLAEHGDQCSKEEHQVLDTQGLYIGIFNLAIANFGPTHSLTMLALTQLRDFAQRTQLPVVAMLQDEAYSMAYNHYVSINDLLPKDDEVQEIRKQDFRPAIQIKREDLAGTERDLWGIPQDYGDDGQDDVREISQAQFYEVVERERLG